MAAQHGCHLFIEKPLSHTSMGIAELRDVVMKAGLITLVGCNMRFHPGPATVKRLIDQGSIGRVLFARVYGGSYLPDWRPGRDYRQIYSARADMGGGCLLDWIHEIDLSRWYLGDVGRVFCLTRHLSSLEIETEDFSILVCEHNEGTVSEIHLDYVQRSYERGCQVVGESGSLFWDFVEGTVRVFDADSGDWRKIQQPREWQVNQMYLDEMAHFLESVVSKRPTVLPVAEGVSLMRTVFAAQASARDGCMVNVGDIQL